MAIKWVFFDIGDVLFNEDAPHALWFHCLYDAMRNNGIDVSWDEYHRQIIESVKHAPENAPVEAAMRYTQKLSLWGPVYHEARSVYEAIRKPRPYGVLLDSMLGVLQEVNQRFQIGIIANQHAEVLQALDLYGISSLSPVRIIDQIVGVSKPDPSIFKLAFAQAGCEPAEAIMVGDRPDNDIAPANSLGMRTVRFRRGSLYVHYEPKSEQETADVEVLQLGDLVQSIIKLAGGE